MKSWNEIRKAATAFSKRWKDAYDEKSQAQSFLKEFDTVTVATFEDSMGSGPIVHHNELISEFSYSTVEERDSSTGALQRRRETFFDKTKCFVARIRCEVAPNPGKLLKFHCAQISDVKFGCNKAGAVFLLKSMFNPTPNDTNLEPK